MATGAVVVGRKTFDHACHWGGDHHGVPIFVPTRGTLPEPELTRVIDAPGIAHMHYRWRSVSRRVGSAEQPFPRCAGATRLRPRPRRADRHQPS